MRENVWEQLEDGTIRVQRSSIKPKNFRDRAMGDPKPGLVQFERKEDPDCTVQTSLACVSLYGMSRNRAGTKEFVRKRRDG